MESAFSSFTLHSFYLPGSVALQIDRKAEKWVILKFNDSRPPFSGYEQNNAEIARNHQRFLQSRNDIKRKESLSTFPTSREA